ncbi:MAG: leucine-rich repeat protein [Paenibacillaceae bacterium]|nr:leucine-rich repeat protein [Paenibacillaceae bacterium]
MFLGFDWKKLFVAFGIVLSVWLIQGIFAGSHVANAADADFQYNVVSGNAAITGYTGTDTVIVIPPALGGYPVTSIETNAFQSKGLTQVTLNAGLASIRLAAFQDNDLTDVEIPASVTLIGANAFRSNELTTLTLHEGLVTIGYASFENNALSEVEIPASVTTIGENAFHANELTTVTLNEGLTSIGNAAFYQNAITTMEIPASVASITDHAFASNELATLTLHEGLTSIGYDAFGGNALTEIEIPASVENIGGSAFYNNELATVTLHEGLASIGDRAFEGNALTEIEIPASVTVIGAYAFYSNDLTTLTLNEGLVSIGIDSFSHNELTEIEIPASVATIGWESFSWNELTKVILNEGLVSIGDNAFKYNKLTEIEIPASVASIGKFAFIENRLTNVTLNEGLASIGDYAFYWNELALVAIPQSVVTIGSEAFGFNSPEFTIIGRINTEAQAFATSQHYPFHDITTLLDIRFAPDGQDWAQEAATTVTGDTYGAFHLQYAWSNNVATPALGAGWLPFENGDEIEQPAEGEWFLHVHGSLLDWADSWHSERFLIDKTPPVLGVTMTAGPSAVPYAHDAWTTGPVTVNATATDSLSGVREIVVETEYESQHSVAAYPGNTYSVSFAGNGIYQLKITATDQAGNASAAEQRFVKIDNSSPSPTPTPPSYEKSGNARLKELLVSTGALTPVFSGDITHYTLRLDSEVQQFTVTMLPEQAQASTSLGGQALGSGRVNADIALEPDVDRFEIVVTAENGAKRTYRIDLEREVADNENAEPSTGEEPVCAETAVFTDIAGHWGEASIIEASCQAIVQGYPDGSFQPDRVITRAEFTVMLVGLFAWEDVTASVAFSDLTGNEHWAKRAIAQASSAGIVSGYPDGSFRPERTITRAEMAVMIAGALGQPTDAHLSTAFADDAQIPAWAKNAVESIRRLGIVVGRGDNSFVPGGAATRAEAALLLLRAGELK